jgi:hypothetical protein
MPREKVKKITNMAESIEVNKRLGGFLVSADKEALPKKYYSTSNNK